jgi:hypothetical protein
MGILNQLSLTISRISRRFEAQTWIRQLDLTNKILKFGKKNRSTDIFIKNQFWHLAILQPLGFIELAKRRS